MAQHDKLVYVVSSLLFLITMMKPVDIQSQTPPYIQITMLPEAKSWDAEVGKDKTITIQVLRNYIPLNNIELKYKIAQEGMPEERTGTVLIKNESAIINIGTLKEPGYKRCEIEVTIDDSEYSNTMTVAYSPELIKPTVVNPPDFDIFWSNAIEKMRRSESTTIELFPVEELSSKDVEVALIHIFDTASKVNFYGYRSKPKKEGKYPVVLFVPAAGVKPPLSRTNFINKEAITLSLEIHGLNPQIDSKTYEVYKNKITGYPFVGLEDRESYYFYRGILNCIKAADYLCSLPEFDQENFAVHGGSQGGYLSIATAALHEKVTSCVSFHPAMADITGYLHGRVGGWPHVFSPAQKEKYNKEEIIHTLSYYDTVNFAKRVKVPVFYSFGYNDETCPATTCSAVLNSIESPVTLFLTPITGHWRIPEMMNKSIKWLKEEQFAKNTTRD